MDNYGGGGVLLNAFPDSLDFINEVIRQFIAKFLGIRIGGFKTFWIHGLSDQLEEFAWAIQGAVDSLRKIVFLGFEDFFVVFSCCCFVDDEVLI